MKKTDTDKGNPMRGGVRRRGKAGAWSYTIDLGPQPARRCNACETRTWVGQKAVTECPKCGSTDLRETCERRQQVVGGFPTRAEALRARNSALTDLGKGLFVMPEKLSLREYLETRWLPALEVGNLRPKTVQGYQSHVRHHLAIGTFGEIPLQKLTRDLIAAHYADLAKGGRQNGVMNDDGSTKALSPLTVKHIAVTLHAALKAAVRGRLIAYNPADGIELSGGQTTVRAAWDSGQLRAFLQATREDRLWPLWVFLSTTGCRRGEALGLDVDDVDFTQGTVTFRRTLLEYGDGTIMGEPKTRAGKRTISLDKVTLAALERQLRLRRQESDLLGAAWTDSGYLFVGENGLPLDPGAVSRTFTSTVERLQLPRITLHGLRHTFATISLNERRAPIGQVSARLGHRDATVTMAIYQHALSKQDEVLAADFAKAVIPE